MKNVKYILGNLYLGLGPHPVVYLKSTVKDYSEVWDTGLKGVVFTLNEHLKPVLTKTGKQARAIRLVPEHLRPKQEAKEPSVVDVQAKLDGFSKQIAGKTGVSSWVSVEDGVFTMYVDKICHQTIARNGVEISRHWEPIVHKWDMMSDKQQGNYSVWFDYVVNESPWEHAFLTKDFDVALKSHVEMNVNVVCFQVMGAITALRMGHEFPAIVSSFIFFIQQGYSKPDAFVLACTMNSKYEPVFQHEGHVVFRNSHNLKQLFQFIHGGYPRVPLVDKGARAFSKERLPDYSFGIQDNIALSSKSFTRDVPFLEQKKDGWHKKLVVNAERMKEYIDNKGYNA